MSDSVLKARLIRLAYQNPELRGDILPLITRDASGPSYEDYVERKRKEGEKPLDEEAWEKRVRNRGKKEEGAEEGKKKPSFKKNYRPKMESVMKKHDMTDDDAAQVIQFSIDRPKKGKPQSPAELMRRFMQNAKPETKERMKGMTPADFMLMLRAVLDDEDGGGKTASIRSQVIRIAYEQPSLRRAILAALEVADLDALRRDADPKSYNQNLASTWEKVGSRG